MKEKIIRFLKANFIIWAFIGISLLIELTGVCVTSGKFLIRRPLMLISMIALFSCVLFAIKNQKGRYWCAFVLLLTFFIVDLVFIVVYDMTGSTFDYSMLKLRADAMAIVESVPINFAFVSVAGISISLYAVLAKHYIKIAPKPERIIHRAAIAVAMALVIVFHGCAMYLDNRNHNPADLSYKLYAGNDSSYSDSGIIGNFIDELYKGAFFSNVKLGDTEELENYIYKSVNTPTEMFGAAYGYNVVTILAESLEWFAFMADLEDAGQTNPYPYGFYSVFPEDYTHDEVKSKLRELYPNLYEFYDTSVVGLNHHSREKTDISENHSVIGNYPTDCYINYDYPENTIPYSVPNVLNALYGVESYSFHNGQYTFYNRSQHHENALGFKEFTASEQMEKLDGFTNYDSVGERNLDSQMIDVCKEKMFPSDRRFNTLITTITMHGQYESRNNIAYCYDLLYNAGVKEAATDEDGNHPTENTFVHYAAAAIEFDRAIGKMMDYLKTTIGPDGKPLIDNTLIVMYGDHNAYYQSLGDTVKDLYLGEKNGRNYTDLFRVPLMIHIGNQTEQQKITKFTTTTDIVPTIYDLLGINYYNSLNYGTSVFNDEESIIYSRAYNVFITDKLFFSSLNNIKYSEPDVTQSYIDEITEKAKVLLDKTGHVNRIFYYDFLRGDNATKYYQKLRELNS